MTAVSLDVPLVVRPRDLRKWLSIAAILVVAYGLIPALGTSYLFEAILLPFLALSLAALGLNILTGYAGQLSLGSAAFMAVGAFAAYNFNLRVPGLPLIVSLLLAGAHRRGIRPVIRPAKPSPARLLSRGVDARGAILRPMGADQFRLVFELQSVRRHRCAAAHAARAAFRRAARPLSVRADDRPCGDDVAARLVATRSGRNFVAVRDNEIAAKVFGVRSFAPSCSPSGFRPSSSALPACCGRSPICVR